jgi:hypothetical protein
MDTPTSFDHGAAIDPAFRAAFLLTGDAELAEYAVVTGIAGMATCDDAAHDLLVRTVEAAYRQYPARFEQGLTRLPRELRRLLRLPPVARSCFLLRMLFRLSEQECARILQLSLEQFHEALWGGLQQLSRIAAGEPPATVSQPNFEGVRR